MIVFKKGNLFDTRCSSLVNTVNCVGVMGKGIALEFKNRFPEMFEAYKKVCKQNGMKIGKIWTYRQTCNIFENKKLYNIVCFPTKEHWMNPSKIEYIEEGLKSFVKNANTNNYPGGIAFPKLGCNNGGLDWETQVKPLMIKYLEPLNIYIEIYE